MGDHSYQNSKKIPWINLWLILSKKLDSLVVYWWTVGKDFQNCPQLFALGTHLGPLEVHCVHEGALEILDPGVLPLEETLQLQVWLGPEVNTIRGGGLGE